MVHKKMISFIIKDAFWKQWVIMMKHIHHSQKLLRAMDNPQGLALRKVGKEAEARGRFNSLISYGEKHLYDTFVMDYFAVSLPDLQIWEDDMNKKNRIHCHYLMGLGHLGLGNKEKADKCFSYIKEINPNFQIWI